MMPNDQNNLKLDNNSKNDIVAKNNGSTNEYVDYDDLLSLTGGFGKYQLVLFISTFPFYVFGGFAYFGQLFITQVSPNHWCWIPELANLTDIERRTIAIPPDEGHLGYSRCFAYDANWTDVFLKGYQPNRTWSTVPCQYGWEFNMSEIPYPTISSDLGWVCGKDSYPATAQSIFFFGSVCGGILFGWVADRFGRLPALVLSNLVGCVGGTASTFARSFVEFSVCRFVYGMANDNLFIMAYLIVLEYVAPKHRAFVATLPFAFFYAPILIALPWIALACNHWKTFNLAISVPIGIAIVSPFIIPESPRWLLSKGRIDKVVERIEIIAYTNKEVVPTEQIKKFKDSMLNQKQESVNILALLKSPLLRRTYICMCLVYMSGMLVFDALVRIIEHLKYDFFVSFSLISLTEIPSLVISAFILDRLGRRRMIAIVMTVCGISGILIAFVGDGIPSLVCAIIARFVINMGFSTITQWAAEILPTSVRGTGTALIHILGFLVNILSPYLVYLEKYLYWLPFIFIGCICGLSVVLAQTIPETAGINLPQTLEDAENLIKSQKMFDILCFKDKEKDCSSQENKEIF